jgi:hypothetical protein
MLSTKKKSFVAIGVAAALALTGIGVTGGAFAD